MNYEVADGLISVNILPPSGSNEPVMGNISIRAYPDGEEWHTFTTEGQHLFETPPGVYEVRVENVPADPDAGHNGYTRNSYPTLPYFVVQSYGINGGGNQLFLNYRYAPVNP